MTVSLEYSRAYYQEHKAERAEYGRQYRAAHKEETWTRHLAYMETHKEYKAAYQRSYYLKHRDAAAEYSRSRRAKKREELDAYSKAYYQKHKETLAKQRRARLSTEEGRLKNLADVHRHQARKRNAFGANYTTADMIKARCDLWGNRCYICGAPMQAIDHVKPLAKGGAHLPCNLRPICVPCNSRKLDRWPISEVLHALFP